MGKYIAVYRKNMFWRCWQTESGYGALRCVTIHKQCTSGEGDIVRHLCDNAHCINPLHHRRGTKRENSIDRWNKTYWIDELRYEIGYGQAEEFDRLYRRSWLDKPHLAFHSVFELAYADYRANEIRELAKHDYIDEEQWKFAKEVFRFFLNDIDVTLIIMEDYYHEHCRIKEREKHTCTVKGGPEDTIRDRYVLELNRNRD